MTFEPKHLIRRPRRPANAGAAVGDVSLQELYIARQQAARFVQIDAAVLPIFERIEREIETRESRMRSLSRAAAAASTSAYIDSKTV